MLTPLTLPERTRVRVHVELVDPASPTARQVDATEMDTADDLLLDLIGAYRSVTPLIDGIPVSEDPDLYLVAEMMGDRATDLHAWEIAPARYRQGRNGRAVRRDTGETAQ